jgi:hypothetical protein
MAITPRKSIARAVTADTFIGGAPDAVLQPAAPAQKLIRKTGKKNIITVSIDPDVLAKVDEWAAPAACRAQQQ